MLAANLRQTASPPGFTGTPKSPSSSRVRATSTRQKPVSAPNQKVPVIQLTPSFSKWPFAVPTERLKWNILFLKCGLLGSSMKPINALRMIFTRQKSVPRTDLEYLYTDEQGLASAQALANKHNGEEKVFYNMALVFMAYSGSGTKSLMEMLTTSHKKLKMDPNIGFSCSFDLIFAEVLAFNFHAAMENFWKDQDDREKYDKGDDVYYHDDEGEKEDFEYFESIKHARAFADALIKALSRVPLPDDFLALRMRSYFNVALRKKSLDESFVNNLLNRIFPNNQDDLLCLDRTLMAPFCMSFIVSGNFEDFIKACKQTYLECSSELAGNPISLV